MGWKYGTMGRWLYVAVALARSRLARLALV